MRTRPAEDVHRFLPLSPVVFEILLALALEDRHGYTILQEVERRTEGAIVLHPGTLYRALGRLLDGGLVDEIEERPDPALDDERRRYYRLTALGRAVAAAEARRLASQVGAARTRRLLRGGPA
jgi:DNA-binding PadR family transcriptional regulator